MKSSENVTKLSRNTLNIEWKGIYIHKTDHQLLKIYRNVYKMSMTAVLHLLFGAGAKCLEEKHVEEIAHLKRQLGRLAGVVLTYRAKYGDIGPKKDDSAKKES